MRKKKNSYQKGFASLILIFILLIAVAIGGLFLYSRGKLGRKAEVEKEEPVASVISPEIENILSKKMETLKVLAQNPVLIEESKKSSQKNADLSQDAIVSLDKKWASEPKDSSYIKGFMTNAVASELIKFQKENPGFVEIFLTDKVGLNVGQTNKTSDFYQADEDWWTGAYDSGRGKSYHSEIEYDDSSGSQSISFYTAVEESDKVVGIIKAVLDVSAIEEEL